MTSALHPQAHTPLASQLARATRDPQLVAAALALVDNELPKAEALLRAHLKAQQFDVAAIRMMAELAGRIGLCQGVSGRTLFARNFHPAHCAG